MLTPDLSRWRLIWSEESRRKKPSAVQLHLRARGGRHRAHSTHVPPQLLLLHVDHQSPLQCRMSWTSSSLISFLSAFLQARSRSSIISLVRNRNSVKLAACFTITARHSGGRIRPRHATSLSTPATFANESPYRTRFLNCCLACLARKGSILSSPRGRYLSS